MRNPGCNDLGEARKGRCAAGARCVGSGGCRGAVPKTLGRCSFVRAVARFLLWYTIFAALDDLVYHIYWVAVSEILGATIQVRHGKEDAPQGRAASVREWV